MVPLKLKPAFKDYIWGGNRLVQSFGMESPYDKTAEAWVLSCHPDGENVIQNGTFAGRTLSDVLQNEGKAWLGTRGSAFSFFPVLIKLIDAKDNLSVQVHPSDDYALRNENQYGKTEAWYILDCDDDAEIIYGVNRDLTKEQFRAAIEQGTLLDCVNRVKVKPGDLFFIASGTLHAICKGILLAEVQQNSNVTYRVYDYGRLQNGKPRELHIEKALDVTNLCAIDCSGKPLGKPETKDGNTETLLTQCDLFTVHRLDIAEQATVTADRTSFVSLVAIDGNGVLTHGDTVLTLYKGESIFLPAGLGDVEILGNVSLLVTTV